MIRILFARLVCAWCGKILGTVPGDKDSHGICQDCKKDLLKK